MATAPAAPDFSNCYETAQPFPHIVLDDFFPPRRLERVAAEVAAHSIPPEPDFYGCHSKRKLSDPAKMPLAARAMIEELNGPRFVAWLEDLTGISGLIADPALQGGGIHQIGRGGFLKVHADFNWHARLGLFRRVNLLLYLNEGWRDGWGGDLEFWPADMSRCAVRVAPIFNRLVVFSTTDTSYHGHPDPLDCPKDVTRNSIALYYYSKEHPGAATRNRVTDYRARLSERFGLKHRAHQALVGMPKLQKMLLG